MRIFCAWVVHVFKKTRMILKYLTPPTDEGCPAFLGHR